ncbi:SDR family oxidoreductase [Oleiagrimonas soli]|uniref:Nucleoside-diphosphate-sugar epimerase n=1 Tax=Oleiagrimonas soli TaxID=1543381 RepID=A0A099CTC5_9GAMM|nr:NAD(P)H-binding protein [Oleiagrimonas soli]KGI76926.1 hypothetical protein LF63_0113485 [Oleiagrimonas soli]MBB6185209.1 nucleoside-diphosphate-sugar epimerase [Oleiagrimonas soli]
MHVVVFGASGSIGRFLLPRLREAGDAFVAVSRRPRDDASGEWVQGALPDDVPALPAVDAVVCVGPLDHFVAWLEQASLIGTPRIVAMSSMSAESKREAPLTAERALAARLRDAEARLAATCERRGLHWAILRATLIYGDGRDRSLTPLAKRAMRWRVFPLPAGRGLRQPVHAQDLAAAVFAALHMEHAPDRVLEAGGGERLSARQMFARVRAGLPRWTLPLPVPRLALRLAALLSPRVRGAIARLDENLIADNRELERQLGVKPRDFRP